MASDREELVRRAKDRVNGCDCHPGELKQVCEFASALVDIAEKLTEVEKLLIRAQVSGTSGIWYRDVSNFLKNPDA